MALYTKFVEIDSGQDMSQVNTLAAIICNNAETIPEQIAISFQGTDFTFLQHYQRALRLADSLSKTGCRAGDRIAILAKNCVEYLELYSACESGGYIIVPINFRLSIAEILYLLENTTPVVCFYTGEYQSAIDASKKEAHTTRHFVRIGASATGNEYEELISRGECVPPAYTPGVDDPACIIHTSGTTGRAKGAVLTQGALHGIAHTISTDADIHADDRGLLMQPLFHVGAKFLQLAHHIRGAAIQLETGFDPGMVWQVLAKGKITTMQLVPTMLDILLDEIRDNNYPQTKLKTIFYSTAPIREALLRRGLEVFGQVFLQQYGSTEGGQVTSLAKHLHITDGSVEEQKWLSSAGKANPGVKIAIIDENCAALPAGEVGEIVVRHRHIMQGYWNDEDATTKTMLDGFLRMGDIGFLDKDGFLYIVDRKKDMIISGGENIYPREVEAALLQHPGVSEVAVIGVPDERWGEAVLAFVVLKNTVKITEQELITFCREKIASYKKPRTISFVESLPRIATGKVDKVSLRRPYWENQQSRFI